MRLFFFKMKTRVCVCVCGSSARDARAKTIGISGEVYQRNGVGFGSGLKRGE